MLAGGNIQGRPLGKDLIRGEGRDRPRSEIGDIGALPTAGSEQIVCSGEDNDACVDRPAGRLHIRRVPKRLIDDRLHGGKGFFDVVI